ASSSASSVLEAGDTITFTGTSTGAYFLSIVATAQDLQTVSNVDLGDVPRVWEETVDLTGSGDFTVGTLLIKRVGDHVTIQSTSTLTFSSATDINSASGAIPEWARPPSTVRNAVNNVSGNL